VRALGELVVAVPHGREHLADVRELAERLVRDRRAVLDDEDPLAGEVANDLAHLMHAREIDLVDHGLSELGEHDLVDSLAPDELRQGLLDDDRDSIGVQRPGERGWVDPVVDPRAPLSPYRRTPVPIRPGPSTLSGQACGAMR
jgi:hypothetical protein